MWKTETENVAIYDLCIAMKNIMAHDSKAATPIVLDNQGLIVLAEQAERLTQVPVDIIGHACMHARIRYVGQSQSCMVAQVEPATNEVVNALRQVVDTLMVVMKV